MPGKPLIGPPDHVQWRRPKGSGGLTACTVTFTRCWRCGGLESAIIKDGMLMKLNAGALRIAALSVAVLGFGQVSAAQEAQKMFIEGDIVRGNTPNGNTGPVCVLANQFKRRENVIFRIRVRNIAGQPLDDKNIKSIVVELSDGKSYPAQYRARPPVAVRAALGLTGPMDYFWSAAWLIPQ